MAERILIVDDDPVQRRLLEAMATRFGYEAVTADGGDAAVALLTSTASAYWRRCARRTRASR
jgi:CheY-like chemotaxis protein